MTTNSETEFDAWLDGIPTVEEDHVFLPVKMSARVQQLIRDRDIAEATRTRDPEDEEEPGGERGLDEAAPEVIDLEQQLTDAIAQDHPDARRLRLRGLSDLDNEEIDDAVGKLTQQQGESDGAFQTRQAVETNYHLVARAVVQPPWTVEHARKLRARINQGEWIRLLRHIGALTSAHVEQVVDVPNS